IGNPVLTGIGRLLFQSPIGDFHCGMRAFRRASVLSLGLRTTGMEFASEMVVKATLAGLRIAEVPITLHKDGRDRPPHLRSWRDGWRHLKFMLLLSPRWTLFVPGAVLVVVGVVMTVLVGMGPVKVGGVTLDVHTLIASSLMMLLGSQAVMTAGALRVHALEGEIGPATRGVRRAFSWLTPGWGMLACLVSVLAGLTLIGLPISAWVRAGLGDLNTRDTLRPMILGATLITLGGQFAMMGFVFGMMRLGRRG
ncbi:MAG: glycosyltransferase family 2 protein, partial [bacterium]|nr:glycosyltransferase family 2 protein [bacterium]